MKRSKDYLINVGIQNWYFLGIVGLISLVGVFYTFNWLPAYDPSTLAQPKIIVLVEYVGFWVGGLGVGISLLVARWTRIVALKIQYVGLLIHTVAIMSAVFTANLYGGPHDALFITAWGATFTIMHINQLFYVRRERNNAPAKRAIGERTAPIIEQYGAGNDLILQTLRGQQHKIDELQARLEGREI